MGVRRYVWILPFLVLLYVYGSEAVGFLLGSTEHYEILSGLGFSAGHTIALAWLSLVIETVIIIGVLWKPSVLTYFAAAVWPWVPRIITALTGAHLEMMELAMSFIASAAALGMWRLREGSGSS